MADALSGGNRGSRGSRFSSDDERFMRLALEQAQLAAQEGEIPVGAVCVWDGRVISAAHNRRESGRSALRHAELDAIDAACRALGGWRLWKCDLYVTLEPCPMCAGAVINSRIRRVVFGASDAKAGSCGSVVDLFALPYNHRPVAEGGCLEAECAALLSEFFRNVRSSPTAPVCSVTPMTAGFCRDAEGWFAGSDADSFGKWANGAYRWPFTAQQMSDRADSGAEILRIALKGKTVGTAEVTERDGAVIRLERLMLAPDLTDAPSCADVLANFCSLCFERFGAEQGAEKIELCLPGQPKLTAAALQSGFEPSGLNDGRYILRKSENK